jgi:beta-glucosidase
MYKTFILLVILFACIAQQPVHAQATSKNFTDANKGLKDYYKDYFTMGVAVSPRALKTDEAGLVLQHFGSITAENAMKMGPIHPRENFYNWQGADSIVAFAQRHGLKLRGHTLCWHNQAPAWMFVDSSGNTVSKEVLLQRLKDHITTVVSRYKGKVYAWDVVNEAISDRRDEYLRSSKWMQIIGEEFIAKAFQWAHEADPQALLFYNDYNEISAVKREKICRLVKSLKDAGVPIHGIGLQAHWAVNEPSREQLDSTLRDFSKLGLKLQITEMDISIYPKEHDARNRKPEDAHTAFTPEREQQQLEKYKMSFELFRKYREHISGVTFWNISERYSWLDNFPVRGRKDYPLLFDSTLKPKKAYWEVIRFSQPGAGAYPFQNPRLTFEARVNDLVSRLTLEEKVAQMLNAAPAIPRLDIPAYDWWNEVLHGVARTPYRVTVFPQAIAMAATFDTNSLKQMADYAALEGRAIYNKAVQQGRNGQRYVGLTYWTPNINIFRDPRWGRGQETYGEDPFLTAMLGRAFVRGLQGNDPKYLKAAACAKHYAVHSGPEPLRHVFNVSPNNYDLWNTYLPAFKELVINADVAGVMCAYNAFKGQPCCGSDPLMVDILRKQWNFTGYVTSDCWAIDDFFKNHKTHPDAASAAADAVLHGTDIDCGTDAYKALVKAVQQGKITEQQIDVSIRRLFMIRFRLGMFDPPSMVKWAQTPESVLERPEHKAHALKMARQSIVLLKNENNTLPLKRTIKKIAVLGPNADNSIAVLGNYNGIPSNIVTALQGIKDKTGNNVEVVYEKAINFTNDTLLQYADVTDRYTWQGQKGFQAEYFNNRDLKGEPVVKRTENNIDYFWQEGQLVVDTLKAYNFSVRYTTDFTATTTGDLTFELDADDGYRFLVDGKEVINAWTRNRWGARTYKLSTEQGRTYRLVVEYYQGEGKANVRLRAGHFARTDFAAVANRIKDADAIVFVGGISPQLEGEEMRVDYPGFNGGDRTSILLPAVQTELLKQLKNTGKPVVFVMMTGSAIAFPWEDQHIPAIVNAWYGGQSAGTAIADVLFGDYNPSGRLPLTFYKSDSDLPAFDDYSMANRTYRYFTGQPLYGFGHGLSYTTFQYDRLQVTPASSAGKGRRVSVQVTNTGAMDGEEVVQLYVSAITQPGPTRSLKGFQRIFLKKGESKTVQFNLTPADLSIIGDNGNPVPLKGKISIAVGGGQPEARALSNKKAVQASL